MLIPTHNMTYRHLSTSEESKCMWRHGKEGVAYTPNLSHVLYIADVGSVYTHGWECIPLCRQRGRLVRLYMTTLVHCSMDIFASNNESTSTTWRPPTMNTLTRGSVPSRTSTVHTAVKGEPIPSWLLLLIFLQISLLPSFFLAYPY